MNGDDSWRSSGLDDPPARPPAARRYDAFHVRVWSMPGAERTRWLRAEVRLLQTDLGDAATDVPPAWLLEALLAHLAGEPLPDRTDRSP